MSFTPWHTDKWFTSPWNFAEEATKGFNFPKKIKFHDVSLRDGEQQAGLVFTRDQKIALADKMAELGMHRIEAGMPAVSAQDREAIVMMEKALLHAEGNFYINDKCTGAVVGQQPFGGGRQSGTNDKAGTALNMIRWMSPHAVKECFNPSDAIVYPYMSEK